jgi:hypothetical protein
MNRKMKETLRDLSMVLVGAVLAGTLMAVYSFTRAYSSFDECVLREMEGRNAALLRFAAQLCQGQFKKTGAEDLPPGFTLDNQ